MAKTLYELAMEYLNQGMPDITQTPRVTPPGTLPPVTLPPQDPNAPTARILPMPGGGGGGNNVYNSDPNSTRTKSNYSPYASRQASERSYIGAPGDYSYSSGTEAQKMMDNYPDYYEGKQLTGIPGAIANYAKNSLPGKIIGGGLNALGDMIPVNRRAILENELLGSGMQLNDIGQFVSDGGDINKADGSNIMAGYNAAKVTQETFDKRRATIEKNMKNKEQKAAKLAALDAAEASFFGAKTKADMVFDDKSLAKDPTYKSLAEQIAIENAINLEKEDDENIDIFDPNNTMKNTNIFTKTPTDLLYDDFPSTITGGENLNDFDGITPITGGENLNDFDGITPITGGENLNDYTGLGPITGGTNLNDYTGLGPITGGTNQNDFVGNTGPITTPSITSDMINEFGTNPTYDPGPFNYQMQPSNVYQGGGSDNSSVNSSGDVTSSSGQYQGNINDEFASAPSYTPSPGDNGGGGNNSGGGGKIVCTMMNESYGFGSFRNKIWLKHSKGLAPEYQKGYHKLFLPLVKLSKTNKIVRKILEHIAIHRTIDIRQESRGKVHLLGRLYRKILEPLCYLVGKHG